MIKKFLENHQTIASVLTIIVTLASLNIGLISWTTSGLRNEIMIMNKDIQEFHKDIANVSCDLKDVRNEIRETNKRIDALFHYVLTKQELANR